MKLTVTCRELRYAGKTLFAGDEFEAADKDAKILKGIGKAKVPGELVVAASKAQSQSDLPLSPNPDEGKVVTESAPAADGKTRRQYRRRDMAAEG